MIYALPVKPKLMHGAIFPDKGVRPPPHLRYCSQTWGVLFTDHFNQDCNDSYSKWISTL